MTTWNDAGDPTSRERKGVFFSASFAGRSGSPTNSNDDNEHILVVDDEASIRLSLYRFFTRRGYRVSVARNGCEALEILGRKPEVDVVVTDLVMPDFDGRELILRMRAEYPTMPVLVISGYPASLLPDADAEGQPVPYLAKPFALDTIAAEVRRLLDERARRKLRG